MADLVDPIIGLQRPMKVMVATSNDDLASDLEAFLSSQRETRLVGTVNRSRECLERLDDWEPDVLLVEEGMGGSLAVDIARSVKQKAPRVAIFAMVRPRDYQDADYHRRLMTTNASGVFQLTEPPSFQNWIQPMRDAVELLDKIPERQGREFGRVLVLHALKGGVGRTLLAANLGHALTRHALDPGQDERRVLLLDLNWPFGGIDTFLNLAPARSALDLLPVIDSLNRQNILGAAIGYLRPSLRVLVSPIEGEQVDYLRDVIEEELFYAEYDGLTDDFLRHVQSGALEVGPEPADALRREMMERMLRKAKAKQAIVQLIRRLLTNAPRYFDFVIVDTPPVIDEVTLSALRNADRLLLVCTPDVPAIRALRNELNILPTFNIPEEQVRLILNLVRRGGELMPREVKALFETRQWLPDVPYDPKIEPLVNTSTLVLEGPRETAFGAAIKNLAKAVLDDRAAARDALPALGVASVYE